MTHPTLPAGLSPAPTDKPALRRPRGRPSLRVDEAAQARFFREVLSRRGVTPAAVLRAYDAAIFSCEPCFQAATAGLGLAVERQRPRPAERGLIEGYLRVSWYFDHVETRETTDVVDDDAEAGEARATSGLEARFYADRELGLFRLGPADAAIWLWTFCVNGRDGALLAAPTRAALRPLLTALRREHRDHQRRAGLTFVGNVSEAHGRTTRTTWDELTLPPALKEELRTTVREFFASAALYRRHHIAHRRGILLAGPPGNGKTSIIRAIAEDLKLPVVVATLDTPQRTHNTRLAFDKAADLAPAVLCFEDVDALVGDGPGLSQFLNGLDGLEPLQGVLIIATTNRPDRIDPAIAKRPSRFDRVFVIGDPALDQRRDYLAQLLGADAPEGAAARVAEATEGYSMAFLKELTLQARLAAVRRGDARLTDADLDGALAATGEHLRLATRGLDERGLGFAR